MKKIKNNHRLLLVSVDVQESAAVTFDSYPKKDGTRKSEYGKHGQIFKDNEKKEGYEHTILYDDGIKSDFVIASASVPINYDYSVIEGVDSKLVNTSKSVTTTTTTVQYQRE